MPPPNAIGAIPRTMSMRDLLVRPDLQVGVNGPDLPANPGVPQGPQAQQGPQVPADQAIVNVQQNGEQIDMQPGNGQIQNFAANHEVSSGRDWDLHSAEGMLETVRKSVEHVKKQIAGTDALNALDRELGDRMAAVANTHREAAMVLGTEFSEFKKILTDLKEARAQLVGKLDMGKGIEDPREALEHIQKQMRVFRWDLQVNLRYFGIAGGDMGLVEDTLRGVQNFFTHMVMGGSVELVLAIERALEAKVTSISNHLRELDPSIQPLGVKPEAKLADAAGKALEVSHRTNDQIRDFWDADRTGSVLRGMIGPLLEKGGSRKVEFNVGVGALIGLGFSSALTAGLRAGIRVKLTGEINVPGHGMPISVTFRIAGGLEGKLMAEAGDESAIAGAKGQATAGASISHFSTRSYATLDDLIADASNCKLATSRTLAGAIGGYVKALGCSIGRLGQKLFRWMGRHSGEVKQDAAAYLQSMKDRHVFGSLDQLLAKRANPLIVGTRSGLTWMAEGEVKGSIGVGSGALESTLSAGAGISRERELKVKAGEFTPLAQLARAAKDQAALQSMMRPGPGGGAAPAIPIPVQDGHSVQELLEARYEDIINAAKEAKKRSTVFNPDKVGYARVANDLRTLMLSTELAARTGRISREQADRLLTRFSNLPVKLPEDIFREYMMDKTGMESAPKIRWSANVRFGANVATGWTEGLTENISSPVLKGVADVGVEEMRSQAGLDTEVSYTFTSETPVEKTDPRPWENVKRTTHTLTVSSSMPARLIIDNIVKTVANHGERVENQHPINWKNITGGIIKDTVQDSSISALCASLPGVILSGVKEAAVVAAKRWLADPENVMNLVMFALDHVDDALDVISGALTWVVEHPGATLQIAASIEGASNLGATASNKVVQWSCVDGELECVTLATQEINTMGVNVDPVGVGLGLGFDISNFVTETTKELYYAPNRPLMSFLAIAEEFMAGHTGLGKPVNGEAFKNWLANNLRGVENLIKSLRDPETTAKQAKVYADALERVIGNEDLREALQDAWHEATMLPQDATPDRLVGAANKLLMALVQAYKYTP